jgi:hypothetical protein
VVDVMLKVAEVDVSVEDVLLLVFVDVAEV